MRIELDLQIYYYFSYSKYNYKSIYVTNYNFFRLEV